MPFSGAVTAAVTAKAGAATSDVVAATAEPMYESHEGLGTFGSSGSDAFVQLGFASR